MNSFKKLPLSYQFTLLLLALAVIAAIGGYLIGASVYVSETRNQARTVADMVDNFGQWATRYRGVWVKDDPRDPKFDVGSFLEREVATAPVALGATRLRHPMRRPFTARIRPSCSANCRTSPWLLRQKPSSA
ncbi:MAG TPA: hypothetical protein PLC55_02375 [Zoogloea sp.]|nr:hypothetical protein [Zoogloea sp.]